MEIYAPNYYSDFACIADKCIHSCCIGWEIDIDKDTLSYYKNLSTPFGEVINNSIACTDGVYHFKLDNNERCPHLNSSNLCNIITNLGKDSLCQICKDHPRFRNFFDEREEIGIGLCCEEAARIILLREDKFHLVPDDSADKNNFFSFRKELFDVISNRDVNINIRLKEVLNSNNIILPDISIKRWFGLLSTLEALDNTWTNILKDAANSEYESTNALSPLQIENLFTYFIYRHLPWGYEDKNYNPPIAFAYISILIINELCSYMGYKDVDDIIEICRMYSSEIEYSEENLSLIFDFLDNK